MNIFKGMPTDLNKEVFETLASSEGFKVERIVSKGHSSPAEGWYDQDQHEWVIVLKGAARIAFEHGADVELHPGDYINIKAHVKHQVAWTAEGVETVWLAVHYS